MASNPQVRIRWGRTLLAAIAVEAVLIVPTIVIVANVADSEPVLDRLIPLACFLLFIPAGYWCGRGTLAPVLNGLVAGLWGIALYVALTLVANGAVADFDLASSVRPAYLLAHGLKVVGGVVGGWLALRKAAPTGHG